MESNGGKATRRWVTGLAVTALGTALAWLFREQLVGLAAALAWPGAMVALAVVFREEVRGVLRTLAEVDLFEGFSLRFQRRRLEAVRQVEELEQEAATRRLEQAVEGAVLRTIGELGYDSETVALELRSDRSDEVST